MSAPKPSPSAEQSADRRAAWRRPVSLGGVLTSPAAESLVVTLADLSERGCRVVGSVDLDRHTGVELSFGGFAAFHASVVWRTDTEVGLHFEQPVHPAIVNDVAGPGYGRRRTRRLLAPSLILRQDRERLDRLRLPIMLERDDAPLPIMSGELQDLSVEGCRVTTPVPMSSGTPVRVVVTDQIARAGIVRWCNQGVIGVEFVEPLDLASVEQVMSL